MQTYNLTATKFGIRLCPTRQDLSRLAKGRNTIRGSICTKYGWNTLFAEEDVAPGARLLVYERHPDGSYSPLLYELEIEECRSVSSEPGFFDFELIVARV